MSGKWLKILKSVFAASNLKGFRTFQGVRASGCQKTLNSFTKLDHGMDDVIFVSGLPQRIGLNDGNINSPEYSNAAQ